MNFSLRTIIVTLCSVYTLFSQVVTLQEGLNGYNGCTDSYMLHSDNDSVQNESNFGDADSILTDLCRT